LAQTCHVDKDGALAGGLAPSRKVKISMNGQLRFHSVVPVCANAVQYRMSLCHSFDGKVRTVNMQGDWMERLGEGPMIEYKISVCARGMQWLCRGEMRLECLILLTRFELERSEGTGMGQCRVI
jgi:hypothetical protein